MIPNDQEPHITNKAAIALEFHLNGAARALAQTNVNEIIARIDRAGPRVEVELNSTSSHPSIFINTLPKSGSLYCRGLLVEQLGLMHQRLAGGYFPTDMFLEPSMRFFGKGGAIAQEHVPANPINIELANRHLTHMVIHVRDPRQATLSWVHHLERLRTSAREAHALRLIDPVLPEGYFERSMQEKVQWNLDHHLPACVSWITDWVDAIDAGQLKTQVLFTRFRKLREDPDGFFAEVFDFHRVNAPDFKTRKADQDMSKEHYRKGSLDEWRSVFTPEQCEQATATMRADLFDQFEWSSDPSAIEAAAAA